MNLVELLFYCRFLIRSESYESALAFLQNADVSKPLQDEILRSIDRAGDFVKADGSLFHEEQEEELWCTQIVGLDSEV